MYLRWRARRVSVNTWDEGAREVKQNSFNGLRGISGKEGGGKIV